ncbi:hypothetical protein KCP75_11635 [Salmonella enterica subsp. enterica]|nr:hypothetical protein KCP75_11635 [Salmonella enterica subsp. enterica]
MASGDLALPFEPARSPDTIPWLPPSRAGTLATGSMTRRVLNSHRAFRKR